MHANHVILRTRKCVLSSLATEAVVALVPADTACELQVLYHDGYALGVDRDQVGAPEERDEVGLSSLLNGQNSMRLEAQVRFEILSDLPDQTHEGLLAEQKVSVLLVAADLAQRDGARPEAVDLLGLAPWIVRILCFGSQNMRLRYPVSGLLGAGHNLLTMRGPAARCSRQLQCTQRTTGAAAYILCFVSSCRVLVLGQKTWL